MHKPKASDVFDAERYLALLTKNVAPKIKARYSFDWTNEMTVKVYSSVKAYIGRKIPYYSYRHNSLSTATRVAEILSEFASPNTGVYVAQYKKDDKEKRCYRLPQFNYTTDVGAIKWITDQVTALLREVDEAENPRTPAPIERWPLSLLNEIDLSTHSKSPSSYLHYTDDAARVLLEGHNAFVDCHDNYYGLNGKIKRDQAMKVASQVMGNPLTRLPSEYQFVQSYYYASGHRMDTLSSSEYSRVRNEFKRALNAAAKTFGLLSEHEITPSPPFRVTDEFLDALVSVAYPDSNYPPQFIRHYIEALDDYATYKIRHSEDHSILNEMNDSLALNWKKFPGCNQFLRAKLFALFGSAIPPIFMENDNEITKVHRLVPLTIAGHDLHSFFEEENDRTYCGYEEEDDDE